jgi:hypothetical protein
MPDIKFAIVDVTGTRKKLVNSVNKRERVPVTLSGFLDQVQNDDGTSVEITMDVTEFTLG